MRNYFNYVMTRASLFFALLFLSLLIQSCTEDNTTIDVAYPDCPACHGRGWFEEKSFLGLKTTYYDCYFCKTRLEQSSSQGGITFRGGATGDPCHYPIGSTHCDCKGFKEGPNWATCARCGHDRSKHY